MPKDTKKTIDKTLILASEITNSNIGLAYVGIATPFPGTKIYENSDNFSLKFLNYNWKNYTTRKPICYTENFSIDDLKNAYYFFNFSKINLEGKNIISSSDLSEYRNSIRAWVKEVVEYKTS